MALYAAQYGSLSATIFRSDAATIETTITSTLYYTKWTTQLLAYWAAVGNPHASANWEAFLPSDEPTFIKTLHAAINQSHIRPNDTALYGTVLQSFVPSIRKSNMLAFSNSNEPTHDHSLLATLILRSIKSTDSLHTVCVYRVFC
jgi:hypothetical protein